MWVYTYAGSRPRPEPCHSTGIHDWDDEYADYQTCKVCGTQRHWRKIREDDDL